MFTCLLVLVSIYNFSFLCNKHYPRLWQLKCIANFNFCFHKVPGYFNRQYACTRVLVKCGKGNIPHHNCFSSLIDIKDSSSCLLWVHTSKWFHYVNNVKGEAVTQDNGSVNLAHAYSSQSLISFCICKRCKWINSDCALHSLLMIN